MRPDPRPRMEIIIILGIYYHYYYCLCRLQARLWTRRPRKPIRQSRENFKFRDNFLYHICLMEFELLKRSSCQAWNRNRAGNIIQYWYLGQVYTTYFSFTHLGAHSFTSLSHARSHTHIHISIHLSHMFTHY